MLAAPQKQITENPPFTHLNLMGIEQIETDNEKLDRKIEELIDTEQQLLNKISAAFYLWKQKNEEKHEQIKILERKCEELAEFLVNLSIHS